MHSHLIVQWQTQKTLLVHLALSTLGYSWNALSSHICCSPIHPNQLHFTALHCIVLPRYHWTFFFVGRGRAAVIFCCCCCFFIWLGFVQIEVCRNPMPSKFVWVLPTVFGHFLFLCHRGKIGIISQILYQKKKIIYFRLKS